MWLESHQEIARHPKTIKLARLIGTGLPAAIGHLHLFWWWAMDYAESGDLAKYEPEELAYAAMWEGNPEVFIEAMHVAGWLDKSENGYRVHDWMDYIGKLMDKRAADRERKRKAVQDRRGSVGIPEVSAVSPVVTVPDSTKPDNYQQHMTNPTVLSGGTHPHARAVKTGQCVFGEFKNVRLSSSEYEQLIGCGKWDAETVNSAIEWYSQYKQGRPDKLFAPDGDYANIKRYAIPAVIERRSKAMPSTLPRSAVQQVSHVVPGEHERMAVAEMAREYKIIKGEETGC